MRRAVEDDLDPPYTEEEAAETRIFVAKFGPSNAWTATGGTAARIIGRLLRERNRLMAEVARMNAERQSASA